MATLGKAAVLAGGIGSEREVSLAGGKNVERALKQASVNALCLDVNPDNILSVLQDSSIDVFFVMLHGKWGEDGQIQTLLENRGLKFTGSGSKASALAFDKAACKQLLKASGLPTPDWIVIDGQMETCPEAETFGEKYDKFVVKPAKEGSSTGISIVEGYEAAKEAAAECAAKYGTSLIERYIPAREFTVGILENQALPTIEIRPKKGFYDYNAKYIAESTEYLFATLDAETDQKMRRCAVDCFNLIGCRGFARVDFLLDTAGEFHILELNTIPGFTSHSLLPKAAQQFGLSQDKLCVKILESALETSSGSDAGEDTEKPLKER